MKKALTETQTLRAAYAWRGPSSISVPNLKRIVEFVQKLSRGPEIRKLGHVTPARPLRGRFMVPTQGSSVLYYYYYYYLR